MNRHCIAAIAAVMLVAMLLVNVCDANKMGDNLNGSIDENQNENENENEISDNEIDNIDDVDHTDDGRHFFASGGLKVVAPNKFTLLTLRPAPPMSILESNPPFPVYTAQDKEFDEHVDDVPDNVMRDMPSDVPHKRLPVSSEEAIEFQKKKPRF